MWASTVMAQEPVTGSSAVLPTLPPQVVVLKKRTDIDQGMMKVKKTISAIYKSFLDTDPAAEGQVVVRLKISSDGQVLDASVQVSDIENKDFLSQLIQLVKDTQFVSGHFEEMEVSYKFDFIPNQALVLKQRTDIDRKMISIKGRMQVAYKKLLDKDPVAEGKVVVRLKIAANGQVLDVSIQESEMNNQDFLNKVIEIIKGIRFESGDFEEAESNYKFFFSAG